MNGADLEALFTFTVAPLELVVRGTAVYWFIFLLFRFVLRRDTGSIGIADVLLLVLIADASQNAMAGGYESVIDGVLLVGTIASWNWLIDWAAYANPRLRRWIEPAAVVLVRDGKPLLRNLRREMISREELMAKLHESGIEALTEVQVARMESGGEITVTRKQRA